MPIVNIGPAPVGSPFEIFPISEGTVFVGTLTNTPGTVTSAFLTPTVRGLFSYANVSVNSTHPTVNGNFEV